MEKQKHSTFKLADWLTREGMPCLGGSFLDGSL